MGELTAEVQKLFFTLHYKKLEKVWYFENSYV
jgi:hypothetical protein